MSDRHIDDVFRQALENHEVSPPFKTWDNIQQHLPQSIPFYRKPAFKAGAAAMLVLVVGVSLMTTQHIFNQYPKTTEQQTATSADNLDLTINRKPEQEVSHLSDLAQIQAGNNLSNSLANSQNNPLSEKNFTLQNKNSIHKSSAKSQFAKPSGHRAGEIQATNVVVPPQPVLSNNSENAADFNDLTNFNPQNGTKTTINGLKSSNIAARLPSALTPVESLPKTELNLLTEIEKPTYNVINAIPVIGKPKKNKTNGLYLGSFYSVHNSWLLNNKALEATKNIEDINYRLRFGKSYGFSGGYDISDKWGIQAEWVLKSIQGQSLNYKPMESVTEQRTEINLTYTYVPLLVKYKFNHQFRLTKQPIVLNYIAGVQYGTLKSAEINLNNPFLQENLLKKSLWGLVAGVDYDVYLTPNYFLSVGARASFSTTSNGFTQIDLPGNSTANQLLLGLRAGFNYRFVR